VEGFDGCHGARVVEELGGGQRVPSEGSSVHHSSNQIALK
jgi:hypothetical protein